MENKQISEKKNIILIQPYTGIFDTITFNIPVGLLAVSRYLHNDFNIIIIDQRFKNWENELLTHLKKKILCVGITCLTGYQIYYAALIAKLVKSINQSIPVIFGGIHPTVLPEQTLKEPYIDFVVIGEGEITFKLLVTALDAESDFTTIRGIGYKRDNNIFINDRDHFLDLKNIPELPYHLIEIEKYKGLSAQNEGNSFLIEGGRGCVHQCIFCFNAKFNKRKWRPFPVEKIIDQISHLYYNHNIQGFFIIDDSFFIDKNRVKLFISELKIKNLKIEWCCEANLSDLKKLSEKELAELEQSGLNWLSVGVESGSERILKNLKKYITITDLYDFNKRIQNYNIRIRYNFMTGYIWDDLQSIRETIDVCIKLTSEKNKIMVQPLYVSVPLPGTEYITSAEENGFTIPQNFIDWSEFDPFSILKFLPWAKKNKKIFELLMYTSFFIDNKTTYHSNSSVYGKIISFFGILYKPIARYRFKNLFHYLFIEKYYFILNNYILKKIINYKIDKSIKGKK